MFTLDSDQLKQQGRIIFDDANTIVYLFSKGQYIGMSKDSRLPAEFNLTDRERCR